MRVVESSISNFLIDHPCSSIDPLSVLRCVPELGALMTLQAIKKKPEGKVAVAIGADAATHVLRSRDAPLDQSPERPRHRKGFVRNAPFVLEPSVDAGSKEPWPDPSSSKKMIAGTEDATAHQVADALRTDLQERRDLGDCQILFAGSFPSASWHDHG